MIMRTTLLGISVVATACSSGSPAPTLEVSLGTPAAPAETSARAHRPAAQVQQSCFEAKTIRDAAGVLRSTEL